jgi:citrate synthase
MGRDAVTITDHRTGTSREAQIEGGTIRASDLAALKSTPDDPGLMAYDPSLSHTASCKSAIGFVDGQAGVLRYRGYPIEELAARSDYLETAYEGRAAERGALRVVEAQRDDAHARP